MNPLQGFGLFDCIVGKAKDSFQEVEVDGKFPTTCSATKSYTNVEKYPKDLQSFEIPIKILGATLIQRNPIGILKDFDS